MPQGPNPQTPGQPGVRGREAQEPQQDRTPEPIAASLPAQPGLSQGRQPQHPGQPGRWEKSIGARDEGAEGMVSRNKSKGGAA